MLFNQRRAVVVFLRAFRIVPVKMVWPTAFDSGDSLVKVNKESVASYFYNFRGGEMAARRLFWHLGYAAPDENLKIDTTFPPSCWFWRLRKYYLFGLLAGGFLKVHAYSLENSYKTFLREK